MMANVEAGLVRILCGVLLPILCGIVTGNKLLAGSIADSIITGQELQTMIFNAQDFDTINLTDLTVIVQGEPVSIYRPLTIYGGTIKRACSNVATLMVASENQSNRIFVDNSDGFAVGDWLLIVSGPGHNQNSGGQILSISRISEDTVETHQSFTFGMDAGSSVIHQYPLLIINNVQDEPVLITSVVFDGNRSCNSYTLDWKYNHTLNVGFATSLVDCTFLNTPAENIFMCGGEVLNCRSYNLNGSFVHGSCSSSNTFPSLIAGNTSYNSCQQSVPMNGHNEGWFTYSANVRNFIVTDNTVINGGTACFGAQGTDDYGNLFSGNSFKNFPQRKYATAPNHPAPDSLGNNIFINCQ